MPTFHVTVLLGAERTDLEPAEEMKMRWVTDEEEGNPA